MNSVENANSQSHEWLREINHLLPLRSNRQPRHCQISFLEREESRDEDPESGKRQGRGHSTPRAMRSWKVGVPSRWDGVRLLQGKTWLWGKQQEFSW